MYRSDSRGRSEKGDILRLQNGEDSCTLSRHRIIRERVWLPVREMADWHLNGFPIFPHERAFSPFFPQKAEVGILRKLCHKVPKSSGKNEKNAKFGVKWEREKIPTSSTIFDFVLAQKVPLGAVLGLLVSSGAVFPAVSGNA